LVLVLAVGAVPGYCLAGETPPPPQTAPTLTASIAKAVALETGKVEKAPASAVAAKQDSGATTTDLTSKSFFKSTWGVVTLVLVGVGTGVALYSTSNDRIKSPSK
jgi:hypothetical protein